MIGVVNIVLVVELLFIVILGVLHLQIAISIDFPRESSGDDVQKLEYCLPVLSAHVLDDTGDVLRRVGAAEQHVLMGLGVFTQISHHGSDRDGIPSGVGEGEVEHAIVVAGLDI